MTFLQEFPTPTQNFSGRRWVFGTLAEGISGCEAEGALEGLRQDGWKTRRRAFFCGPSRRGGGPPGMLFHLPHLNLRGIHVPEHFTGIWVQGKPRQPGKSVITLELPISWDRCCCFQRRSKGSDRVAPLQPRGARRDPIGPVGGLSPARSSRLGSVGQR